MKLFLFLIPSALVCAQPFSAGVKIGGSLSDAFNVATGQSSIFSASNKRLVIGPTAELRLPFGFGIEVDALYRRFKYSLVNSANGITGSLATANTKSGAWEFPILAKFRSPIPVVKPYAVGGLAFSKLTGIKQSISCLGGNCSRSFSDVAHDSNVGLVLGGGVQVNALLLKISPEIRYTRWGFANFDTGSIFGGNLKSNQNQVEVLVGITF